MARSLFSDYLQTHTFWLFDVAPIEGFALPIFNPLAGFASITAPGMTFETYDVTEGNWFFRKKVIKKADIDPITLTRGVTFWDSDFWRWSVAAITGDPSNFQTRIPKLSIGGVTPRRDLLLIQFFPRYPGAIASGIATGGIMAGGVASAGTFGAIGAATATVGAALNATIGGIGPYEFAPRIPAKAWMLRDCIPTRFKAAGDFDAKSAEVSMAEIEIQPEMFEELSLAS